MKRIKYIWLALLATSSIFVSCNDDYVEPDFKPYDFAALITEFGNGTNTLYFNNSDLFAAKNLSQGQISHQFGVYKDTQTDPTKYSDVSGTAGWVEAKPGIQFLQQVDGFSPENSLDDFSAFVNPNIPSVNSEETVVFQFLTAGRYKFNVHEVYDRQISYEIKRKSDGELKGYMEKFHTIPIGDGTYYANLDLEVMVFDALLGKAIAYTDDTYTTEMELVQSDVKDKTPNAYTITVTEGETLYFMEDSGYSEFDSSTECDWYCENALNGIATTSEVTLEYDKKMDQSKATYAPSKLAVKFNTEGYYKVYINQQRFGIGKYSYDATYLDSTKEAAITTAVFHVVPAVVP